MAATTIEWCEYTFNPWRGCTKVSPGCTHCYADALSKRNPSVLGEWGPNGTRVVASEAYWQQPLKWNREASQPCVCACHRTGPRSPSCEDCEHLHLRPKVFCASLADVFEDWDGCPTYPDGAAVMYCRSCQHWGTNGARGHGNCCEHCDSGAVEMASLGDLRRRLFALIDATPHLDWLLLTKRPENVRRMWPTPCDSPCRDGSGNVSHDFLGDRCLRCDPVRQNVWIGTSVEDQDSADKRIAELLKLRDLTPVLFVSAEPLLGPIALPLHCSVCQEPPSHRSFHHPAATDHEWKTAIDWVIVGGESGPHARPMHPHWVLSLRNQCQSAGVPFYFKQWGEWAPVVDNVDRHYRHGSPTFYGGNKAYNIALRKMIREHGATKLVDDRPEGWQSSDIEHGMGIHGGRDDQMFLVNCGKKAAGRLLDGREWNEFPQLEAR